MKLQFSTKSLLLATAAVAISFGGMLAWAQATFYGNLEWVAKIAAASIPFWLPFAFAAFAIGRRALTVRMVLAFAVAEAAGVGIMYLLITYFD